MNRLASRKFLVALLALGSASGALALGYISADIWSTVTITVSGMYLTANVAQDMALSPKA